MSVIRVSPTEPEPTHHFSLSDGVTTLGVYLCNSAGAKDVRSVRRNEAQRTPLKTQSGPTRHADFELPWNVVEQNDWSGGRGNEDFEENAARYLDGSRIDTFHAGQLILGGQERYCTGYRNQDLYLPGNLSWYGLYGSNMYLAAMFTASANYTADKVQLWVRKKGTPNGVVIGALYTYSGGFPGSLLASASLAVSAVEEGIAVFNAFDWVSTPALSSGTSYCVVIYGAPGDDVTNHWEVGAHISEGGFRSTDGLTWGNVAEKIYFRVTDADQPFIALFFEYKGQLYFATRPDDGSAGKVYMNGWRGLADDNSTQLNRLNDSTQTGWGSTLAGAIARITDGEGAQEDQAWRKVTGGGSGYLTVSPNWNIYHLNSNADATQYAILNSDKFFLQQTGVDPFQDVAVTGEMAWLASGEKRSGYRPVYKMREYSDYESWQKYWGSESLIQASFLQAIPHPTLGYILWLGCNNDTGESVTITRAPAPRDHNQALITAFAYHGGLANGFMKEQLISPLASDSLNRADGSLGSTNGAGHTVAYPFGTGGSGIAWVEFTGTWGVVSNRAKCSALSGGKGLAGWAPAENDVVVRAKVYHSSGMAGVFVRRADDNNYIYGVHDGSNIKLVKRVGGVETIVIGQTTAYVDGAEIEVKCNLTTFTIKYNGVQIDTPQVIGEAGLQTGAGVGLFTDNIANTFDNVYTYTNPVVITTTGSNSAKIDIPASFETGLICSDEINNEDWRRFGKLYLVIKSTKALAAGELQLLIDNNTLCGSPIKTVDFPALAANATYGYRPLYVTTVDIEFDISDVVGADGVRSAGLKLTVDPSVDFSLYVSFRFLVPDVEAIAVGDSADPITGLERYGDPETLWVLKQGSIWEVSNDIPTAIPLREMASVKSHLNGRAHLVHDVYLYYSLLHSLERYFRQNVDDVGPNRDAGLPADRQGYIAHMVGYPGRIYAAINGGADNYSSVLCYTGTAWHEVYRAPKKGLQIRRLHIQPIPGSDVDKLWISQGADVLWIPLPSNNFNPYYDSNYRYAHESVIDTSWFYCGLQDVVKRFKSVKLFSEGLAVDAQTVDLYYQLDQQITWTKVSSSFITSPVQEINLSPTNSVSGKRIRFRLVFHTTDATKTPKITALILEALERIRVYEQFTMEINLVDGLLELGERDPDDTSSRVETQIAKYDEWKANLTPLTMRSVFSPYDNKTVMIQSFGLQPIRVIADEQQEQHIAQATVIEI